LTNKLPAFLVLGKCNSYNWLFNQKCVILW